MTQPPRLAPSRPSRKPSRSGASNGTIVSSAARPVMHEGVTRGAALASARQAIARRATSVPESSVARVVVRAAISAAVAARGRRIVPSAPERPERLRHGGPVPTGGRGMAVLGRAPTSGRTESGAAPTASAAASGPNSTIVVPSAANASPTRTRLSLP